MQWLKAQRFEAARQALLHPQADDTVASIARRHGFADLSGFAMGFRRRDGVLPSGVFVWAAPRTDRVVHGLLRWRRSSESAQSPTRVLQESRWYGIPWLPCLVPPAGAPEWVGSFPVLVPWSGPFLPLQHAVHRLASCRSARVC
ncbi:AraC family transcriptional regulator [Synechococcus sp. Tobar12-5m-g]|uniref:helix-turn-helix domain-containing protein n=1 Tax=unclassified Synechococcus TaxID=2626047 RepID=UPI0037D9C7FC|nr:AraC family transcriptional regulator [Synechococcus sp. Tobar12-5m-g]MCP9874681.1 AraC family transcriptional regulator [Synechococcus sp. Cruz CV-v-12]